LVKFIGLKLSVSERIQLVEDIWDSIAVEVRSNLSTLLKKLNQEMKSVFRLVPCGITIAVIVPIAECKRNMKTVPIAEIRSNLSAFLIEKAGRENGWENVSESHDHAVVLASARHQTRATLSLDNSLITLLLPP